MVYGVANHRDIGHIDPPRAGEGKEGGGLHLHGQHAFGAPAADLLAGFPVRGVRGPNAARPHSPASGRQFVFKMGFDPSRARHFSRGRQVMERGALVANRTCGDDQTRKREIWRDPAGGRQPDDQLRSGRICAKRPVKAAI